MGNHRRVSTSPQYGQSKLKPLNVPLMWWATGNSSCGGSGWRKSWNRKWVQVFCVLMRYLESSFWQIEKHTGLLLLEKSKPNLIKVFKKDCQSKSFLIRPTWSKNSSSHSRASSPPLLAHMKVDGWHSSPQAHPSFVLLFQRWHVPQDSDGGY